MHRQKDLASTILPARWITGGIGTTPQGSLAIRVAPGHAQRAEQILRRGGVTVPLDVVEMEIPRPRLPNPALPQLATPISFDQLYDELCWVCDLGRIEELDVALDAPLTAEHERNPRRYAQVTAMDDPPTFEFAEQMLRLPWPNRLGLYAHEVGHVLDPDPKKTEPGADATAQRELGITIGYDHRWPGKGLQVAVAGPGVN